MRRPDLQVISHEGTIGSDGWRRASIFQGAEAHFIRMLIDAYPNPYEAVPREYICNAIDAHVEAGNPAPIEVDTPTPLRPTLVIRDNGVGMSLTEVESRFLSFGESTKQHTNDQIGSLGIGCKCAITLVDQFTVSAVKDGVRVVALITKQEDGVPALKVLDTADAQGAPNGLEIQIPISDIERMNREIQRLVRFFDEGIILVNGQPTQSIFSQGQVLEDDSITLISNDPDVRSHLVVMGGIAYPFDARFFGLKSDVKVVAKVPIGCVDFTMSREKIFETPNSVDTIAHLKEFVERHSKKKIQEDLDKILTRSEALRKLHELRNLIENPSMHFHWHNESFPGSIPVNAYRWRYGYSSQSCQSTNGISQESMMRAQDQLIVIGSPQRSPRKETKQAIIDLCQYANKRYDHVYFIHRIPNRYKAWFEEFDVITREELHPKKPRAPRQSGPRPKRKWDVALPDKKFFEKTDVDLVGHIVWLKKMDAFGYGTRERYRNTIRSFLQNDLNAEEKITIVLIGENEVEQFQRAYPQARDIQTFVQEWSKRIDLKLTDDARVWGTRNHVLARVPPETWLDPLLQAIGKRVHACLDDNVRVALKQRDEIKRFVANFYWNVEFRGPMAYNDFQKLLDNWAEKYPLFRHNSSLGDAEVEAINALWHYRKYQNRKVLRDIAGEDT